MREGEEKKGERRRRGEGKEKGEGEEKQRRRREGGERESSVSFFTKPLSEGKDKSLARKIFEIVHPNLGRITIILASITIFAGISEADWHWWVFIFYAVSLAVLGALSLVLEWRKYTNGDDE
jgi:hypothetical protein